MVATRTQRAGVSERIIPGSAKVDRKKGDTRSAARPRRRMQKDLTENKSEWDSYSLGDDIASDFARHSLDRTTRAQLAKEQWNDTKPRELSKEERISRINVRGKDGPMQNMSGTRQDARIAKIRGNGKEDLLRKITAKKIYKGVVRASWFNGMVIVGAYIPYFILYFILGAESTAQLFWYVSVTCGLVGVMLTLLIYKMSPVTIYTLSGNDGFSPVYKWLLLIIAIFLHIWPGFGFAPWYLLWAWYVSRHPA